MKIKPIVAALTVSLMMTCTAAPAFAETDNNVMDNNAVATQEETVSSDGGELIEQNNEGNTNDVADNEEPVVDEEAATTETTEDEDQLGEEKADQETSEQTADENQLAAPIVKKRMESTKRVELKWSRVKAADGYIMKKYDKKVGAFKKVKTFKAKKRKVLIKNIKPGKKTVYQISAYEKENGKILVGKSKNVVVKTPKVLKQSSKGFKQTNAYKVIKAAKSKLGCAYVSGAQGPRAFDCSGYTYYLYNKVGAVKKIGSKKFVRSSAQGTYSKLRKYNIGRDVSKAQPGDIMLFSRSGGTSGIYHAAIYYGGGKIIHASSPSTGVIVSYIAHRKVAAIIRLPKM